MVRKVLMLSFCILAPSLSLAAWQDPYAPSYGTEPPNSVLVQALAAIDRNTTRFQDNAGKILDVVTMGCDFPAEADANIAQIDPKDLAGVNVRIVVRAQAGYPGGQSSASAPTQAAAGGKSQLAKQTDGVPRAFAYVYVYDQNEKTWVSTNYVALAAGLAWMVNPEKWPVNGPEDSQMIASMKQGVTFATNGKTGLYSILDNPKSISYEDVKQLFDNFDAYWFPPDVRSTLKNMLQQLSAEGEL